MDEIDLAEIVCGLCNEVTPLSEEVQESIVEFLNNGVEQGQFEIEENNESQENEGEEKRSEN